MSNNNTKVFFHVKQLKDECKFKEALQIINDLEKKLDYTTEEKFEIYFLKISLLFELGQFNEFFKYIDLVEKDSSQIKDKLQIIDFLIIKSKQFLIHEENDEALKILSKAEQLIDDLSLMEFKEKSAIILLLEGRYYFKKGDFKRSLEYVYKVLRIAKEIKNNILKLEALRLYCFIYGVRGDHKRVLDIGNWYLELARRVNNKQQIISALNVLGESLTEKEEFSLALNYLKQALSICDEISSFKTTAVLTSLFNLYLEIKNLSEAEQCLNHIKEIKNQEDIKWLDDVFRLEKASFLKEQPEHTYQIKAREIFKQIVDDEGTFYEFKYVSLIQLCDSYLIELGNTNNLKILDELQPYLAQLIDLAINQQSYWLLVESYLFQAKLKLITFEFGEAEKFLDLALSTAEKYGQTRLYKLLMKEQSELSRNLIKWEKLKDSGATIAERMNLARIDEQIALLLQKRRYLKTNITS
ncbi:MAG: hypothetical protein ACFFEN_12040 [Candidatus Thorarchaeota archaeon]